IDVIRSVAPEAQIYNYSTGGGSTVRSFIEDTADIVDRITQDGRADIATMSWGICDVSTLQDGTPYVDAADRSRAEDAFKSAADPDSGYFTVTPNEKTGASEAGVSGGTSAASPFWAASMLLIEQYAERHGVKKLGFVAPALYYIAQHQNAAAPSFHDITIGGN